MASRSNCSAVSLGFTILSWCRGWCAGGAEQQFDQSLDQLLVLAGRERHRCGLQQGKIELRECRLRLNLRLHGGPPWASAKPYRIRRQRARGGAGREVPAARWRRSAGGPRTKAAQAALSIHAGNAQVVPLSNWTKT